MSATRRRQLFASLLHRSAMDSSASVCSPLVVVQSNMDKENAGNKASSYKLQLAVHGPEAVQCAVADGRGAHSHTAADHCGRR